jgi:transposase
MHGAEFKKAVIATCREPGVSVAAVAQAHGLNANLVRKWLVGRGVKRLESSAPAPVISGTAPAIPFVPVQLPAPARAQHGESGEDIQIELTRGEAKLTVRWPAAQASTCASWLGELAPRLAR